MTRPPAIWMQYLGAVLIVALAAAIRFLLEPALGATSPFLTFFPAVVLVAWAFGYRPTCLAVVLSCLTVSYFFLAPRFDIEVHRLGDQIALGVFAVFGFVTAALSEQVRRARARADRRQRQLEEERRRWQITLASIGDAVIATDAEGRVTFLNTVASDLTGWSAQAAVGKALSDVFVILNEQSRLPIENPCEQALKKGTIVGLANHTILIAKDGAERPIDDSASPIRDDTGRIMGAVLIFRDVTQRRRQEAELRDARSRLQATLTAAEIGTCVFDLVNNTVVGDENFVRMYGLPAGTGSSGSIDLYQKLIHPDDWELLSAAVDRSIQSGSNYETEHRILRPDGTIRWVAARGRAERDENGKTVRVPGVIVDITQRKQIEDELREARSRLESTLASGQIGTWDFDFTNNIVRPDANLARIFGISPELAGAGPIENYIAAIHPDDRELVRSAIQESINTGKDYAADFRVVAPDRGVRYIIARGRVQRDASGRAVSMPGAVVDNTPQKLAEERERHLLAEAERRWRGLAEAVPNLVWTDRADGTCDYLSGQWATYTGIPVEQLLGLNWLDIVIHPDDRERTAALWREACADRADYDLEYRIRRHDGVYHWFKTRGVPIRDQQGQIVYWFGTCTDIEDQKQSQEALAQSEERFRQLADAMPQIVWTALPNGAIDYVNRQWKDFTGMPESKVNEGWERIVHPGDDPASKERWAFSLQHGTPFEMDIRLWDRHRQTYRWHLIRTVAVRDKAGELLRWYGTSTDIHEQKQTSESFRFLAESSAALSSLVDFESTLQTIVNLAVPYFADWATVDMAEPDGTLRRLALAHVDPTKVELGHELHRRFPPDPRAPQGAYAIVRTGKSEIIQEINDTLLEQTIPDPELLDIARRLGLRSYMGVPLEARGRVLGVITFISAESDRKYTPADLALAEDLARRAAIAIENAKLYGEMRAADRRKDEFLAMLAHELRNPLAPIRNALHVMRLAGPNGQVAEQSRSMMERQLGQMVRLVDDLLDVSRITRNKLELRKESVELAAIIQNAVETSRPLIDQMGHTLTVTLPEAPILLHADPTRLAQVFANLLNNSAKYTERGGNIWLVADLRDHQAVITVRDNGIGIPVESQSQLFELFTQVNHHVERAQGGLGIGLTLVRRLVEMHGGTVAAVSAGPGLGSEFIVRLPVETNVAARPIASATAEVGGSNGPRRRILVVDDNRDLAMSLSTILSMAGNEIRTAHDGLEAVAVAIHFRPDIILLDIGLPKMNGHDACRQIRQQPWGKSILIVACTGWGQDEDRSRSREAGFDLHMVKPIDPVSLEKLLREVELPR